MATGRQGARRRPSKGAVAGRLIGAFVLGTAVMGGGLYLLDHSRGAADGRRKAMDSQAVPGGGDTLAGDKTAPAARRDRGGLGKESAGAAPGGATAEPDTQAPPQAPFGESEEVFETGARVYVAHCASCHGGPGRTGSAGGQFWGAGAAAVAAEPVGLIFRQTANGVPPGMKGYRGELQETEMWDVALLLRNAGQELPDPVIQILRGRQKR